MGWEGGGGGGVSIVLTTLRNTQVNIEEWVWQAKKHPSSPFYDRACRTVLSSRVLKFT